MSSGLKAETEQSLIWLREEPCARNPRHSRAAIARAGIEIADRDGLEAVSMRRVAEQLGAGTMTLYHYVANKDELLTLMMDEVMGEVLVPAAELQGEWRPAITGIAIATLASLRHHRWMIDLLGEPRPGPNKLRHLEQSLEAMDGAGLAPPATLEAIVLIDEYVFGFAVREAQEPEGHETGWPPSVRAFYEREIGSGEYPRVRALLGEDLDSGVAVIRSLLRQDTRFERGLASLLDGIEASFSARS